MRKGRSDRQVREYAERREFGWEEQDQYSEMHKRLLISQDEAFCSAMRQAVERGLENVPVS